MEIREQLQYIDKLTNAIDRNDFESFQKIFNELQGNYINIAPPMLLETISAVLEHLNQSSKIMQSYTRHLSSCFFVGCTHSPRSHSYLCSRGFAPLPPRCILKSIGYIYTNTIKRINKSTFNP